MEEQIAQTVQAQTPNAIPVQNNPKKKDPFSLFGKITAVVIIGALLIGGGIFLGLKMTKKSPEPGNAKTSANLTTETGSVQLQDLGPVDTTPSTATPAPTLKTITGGITDGSTAFKPYLIQIPDGWTESTEKTELTNKLTLVKNNYELSIYQAPMGGSMCIYPGDADGDFKQKYTKYKEIKGSGGQTYRRSWDDKAGSITFTVCQKGADGTFGTFTTFGGVTIKTPNPSDESMMQEIDDMIASLEAQ